jgi:outer membrane receptor for ferrienterochelin and colicins
LLTIHFHLNLFKTMYSVKTIAMAVLCTAAFSLRAQDSKPDTPDADLLYQEINEIVVTATGTPNPLSESPVQTEVITEKKMASMQASTVEELLTAFSPSVSIQPNIMGTHLSMNGLPNDFILILVDGQRMTGDFSGSVDLSRIDMDQVARIEIVKGAASALYGSDAMGGVINIITKKPVHNLQVSTAHKISAHGGFSSSNRVMFRKGSLQSTTGFTHKRTDGWQLSPYETKKGELVATEKMAMHPQEDYQVNQRFIYTLTPGIELNAKGSMYRRDLYRPVTHYSNGYRFDDHSLDGGLTFSLPQAQKIVATFSSQTFSYSKVFTAESGDFKPGDEDLSKLQRLNNARLVTQLNPTDNQRLILGAEWLGHFMESPNLPKQADQRTGTTRNDELAVWVQEEWQALPLLDLVIGFRHNYHFEYGHHSAPKLALQFKPGRLRLRANIASGYKTPSLLQLYYSTITSRGLQTFGNQSLKPETGMYSSLSAEYVSPLFTASITGYYNDIRNLIELELLTDPLTEAEEAQGIKSQKRYTNLGETYTRGIDCLAEVRPGFGFRSSLGYSYTHARGRVSGDEPFLPLEKISEHAATFQLGWEQLFGDYLLNLMLNGRFEDEKYFADGNTIPYQQWDFNTHQVFRQFKTMDLSLGAGIRNLFDETDNSPFGSNYATIDPGRRVYLSLKLDFKL